MLTKINWRTAAAFAFSLGVSEWFLWHHIFWRDEAQAIMIAVHSPTLPALLSQMGYNGTPGLWYLPVWATRFIQPWWDLKLWTVVITAVTLYVIFFRLGLGWPMALAYAMGVQLATFSFISRSYGLSVLLFLLFAYCEKEWRRRPGRRSDILLSVVLFLLTQSNIHSVLIAAGIVLYLASENLLKRRPVSWLPVAALGLGALVTVLQVLPPADLGPVSGWHTQNPVARYLAGLVWLPLRLLLPFYGPNTSPGFGNIFGGNWLFGLSPLAYGFVVLELFGFYVVYRTVRHSGRRTVPVVLAVIVPLLLFAALEVFKYPLELEHLYLLIPYALALYVIEQPAGKTARILAWSLLSMHLLGAASGIYAAATVPYDIAPAVVGWIDSHGYGAYLARSAIAVFPDPSISTMTLYGNLPKGAYALVAHRFETYTPWDTKEPDNPVPAHPPRLPKHLPGVPGPYLLLTYYPFGPNPADGVEAVPLATFPTGPWIHWAHSPGAYLFLLESR